MPFLPFRKHLLKHHFASVFALGLSLAGLSTSLWANTEISAPANVIILDIDGQATGNTGLFSKKLTTYPLSAGEHTITARYDHLFQSDTTDDYDVIRSHGVTIKATLLDQKSYLLGWQPEPQTREEAEKFVKQPTLIITAASGTVIATQQGAVQPNTSFIGNIIHGAGEMVSGYTAPTITITPLQQLQSAWQQASPEQQQRFNQWVKQQPSSQ